MAEHRMLKAEELEVGMEVAYPTYVWAGWHRYYRHQHWKGYTVKRITPKRTEDVLKSIFGDSDDKPKKSGKAVVVSVDADAPAEDVAKQISEVVAKTVAEMMGKKKEE